ncbi:MAG: transporter substrate-binding domain-containing protein [Candidatus Omnitrophica bacterium]|nr:transporter substrate-binding domain-containing protein [Candidatus Omnitrophota bacterium]
MRKKSKIVFFIFIFFFINLFSFAEDITILAEDSWYPYSGLIDGRLEGIAVDIVRAAFLAEGITVEFIPFNYDRAMKLVKDGNEIACFDTPRTKEIEELYLWHNPALFTAKSYFYAKATSTYTINSINDIGDKRLGLTEGYGYGNTIDTNYELNKIYSKSDEILVKKLIADRLDLIILYDKVADYLIKKLNVKDKIKPVGISETNELYLAFSKNHPDGKKYCEIFSRGLQKIIANGTYTKIWQNWKEKLKSN